MTGNIDFSKSEQYILSIRLSADGFSFSIYNPQAADDLFFQTYEVDSSCSMTVNVKEMLARTEALRHPYQRINILYDTARFTPVPIELFEDEQMDDLFYHNLPQQGNEIVLCNVLGKSNVAIVFGMDKHVHQLLTEQFPTARFFSTVSPLTEYFARKSRTEHNKLYANLHEQQLDVFAYEQGRLGLINSFPCKQTADRSYYLLYAWQQLGYDQEQDELYLTEPTDADLKALQQELQHYVRHVLIIRPDTEFGLSSGFSQIEDFPFDMQTLLLCE